MSGVRLAVVGVGALGQHHARILSGMPDVELVAVVDAREQQGRAVAEKHRTRWLPDPAELVSSVDGIVVAVPTVAHASVAEPFLNAGIAVLSEKPLADSLASARKMANLAEFRRATLQVGHVERFNPAFEILREQVRRPLYIRAQRVSPYTFRSTDIGVVHDLMIHDIDLVLALTGDEIASVDAFGAVTFGPHEDMAVARLRTRSGVIADITSSRMNPAAERTMQVWDEKGFVSADFQSRKVTIWKPAPLLAARPEVVREIVAATPNPLTLKDEVFTKWIQHQELQGSSADALTAELRDFVTCIQTGATPRVTGADAVLAMEVADRVLTSMPRWSWQAGAFDHSQTRRWAA